MKPVHIKVGESGWILEKLATRLAESLGYVDCSDSEQPRSAICYYFPYATFKARVNTTCIGYFTHVEQNENRRRLFFDVSKSIDHCVSQSRRYGDILAQNGPTPVSVISPGVDLELFRPEVRIGVVGRTYRSGRKGEGLIAQLMNMEGIRWIFTGTGWPGPATYLTDGDMPAFYNSIDYVLVPSLYEGGPMCVVEALACGKPVIAPAVGWVEEFPHIPFKTGDVHSLAGVLAGIVEERKSLRRAVLDRTWARWCSGHDELFRKYLS